MASTLDIERRETRRWMRDDDPNAYAIGTRLLNRIMEARMRAAANAAGLGQTWQNSALTLTAGTTPPDVSLPTTSGREYAQVVDLRRHSDGYILPRVSQEEIQARRYPFSSSSISTGSYVEAYALIVSDAQLITAMFDVVPTVTDTVDLLFSAVPATFDDADTSAIPFDRDLLEGYRMGCALDGILAMDGAAREARGFDSNYLARLGSGYADAVKEARLKMFSRKLSARRLERAY